MIESHCQAPKVLEKGSKGVVLGYNKLDAGLISDGVGFLAGGRQNEARAVAMQTLYSLS